MSIAAEQLLISCCHLLFDDNCSAGGESAVLVGESHWDPGMTVKGQMIQGCISVCFPDIGFVAENFQVIHHVIQVIQVIQAIHHDHPGGSGPSTVDGT